MPLFITLLVLFSLTQPPCAHTDSVCSHTLPRSATTSYLPHCTELTPAPLPNAPGPLLPTGMKCVELGAGVGLVGLALAAMGARVTITDVEKVLPLMHANLATNGFDPARG